MILLIENKSADLFSDGRLAVVSLEYPYLKVTFDQNIKLSPKNSFQKGDYIGAELLARGELSSFLRDIHAKALPLEIHSEDTLRDVVERVQSI